MAKRSKRTDDRRVDIRLPPYQYLTISELAREHGTTISMMIRALLKKSLDEIEKAEDEQEGDFPENR